MAEKNVEVLLKNVRISFAHLFEPQPRKNDRGELTGYNYSLNALLDKKEDADLIATIKAAMKEAREGKWGDSPPRIPADRLCLRDGEPIDPETADENVPGSGTRIPLYEGYEGKMYLSANRGVSIDEWEKEKKNPVALVDNRKDGSGKRIRLKASDGKLYSGCYADVIVRIYGYYSDDYPARINASLEAVKFRKHGDAFGAKPIDPDAAFDDDGDDDDDVGDDFADNSTSKPASKPAAADDDMLG